MLEIVYVIKNIYFNKKNKYLSACLLIIQINDMQPYPLLKIR